MSPTDHLQFNLTMRCPGRTLWPYEPESPIETPTAMPGVVQLAFPPAPPRDDPGDERERSPRRRRGSDVSTEAPLPEPSPPDASMDPVSPKRKPTRAAKGAQNDFEQNLLLLPLQVLRCQLIKNDSKPRTLLCQQMMTCCRATRRSCPMVGRWLDRG